MPNVAYKAYKSYRELTYFTYKYDGKFGARFQRANAIRCVGADQQATQIAHLTIAGYDSTRGCERARVTPGCDKRRVSASLLQARTRSFTEPVR